MGSTTWFPRIAPDKPKQWLLANGEIVNEPPLEMTTTGRKVRVAGTDVSAYARDMDDLVLRAVQQFATRKQTSVWMPLHDATRAMEDAAGFEPATTKAELYVLKKGLGERTIAWWRFKHPALPIEAILSVTAGRVHTWSVSSQHEVQADLVAPNTAPTQAMVAEFVKEVDGYLSRQVNRLNGQAHSTAREFVRDRPPTTWDPQTLLGRQAFGSERLMVEALLAKVRGCEEIESIQIPDLRDPDHPAWLELELYETNVNANFLSDLTEYLEGTPTVTEALRIYKELQECLRGIGLVLDDRSENDFQRGLLSDEPAGVTVQLSPPHDVDGKLDHAHTLRMHLPTGTFVVDCSATINHNEVAEQWEEARVVASLSGEENTLLAFARESAKRDHEQRARTIIKERRGTTSTATSTAK